MHVSVLTCDSHSELSYLCLSVCLSVCLSLASTNTGTDEHGYKQA